MVFGVAPGAGVADVSARNAGPPDAAPRRQDRGTILGAIGDTPLVRVDGIWVKLEYLNPSGSVKDRIAKYMIERAEREGLLRPGDTIVEASSGNTGNAMSMVAAVKGYRMLVVMPNGMSPERLAISRAFGASVMTVGDFHVNDALATAAELGCRPGYFAPRQFDSEWNVEENRTWLGPETLAQLPAGTVPDAVVAGVGTGGTIAGVGQCFRTANPSCRIVAVEPSESCTLLCGEVGQHLIEGISDGFVPGIVARHRHLIDQIVAIDSSAAIAEMRRLARQHGLFAGPSSGANLLAARQLRAADPSLRHIVTFFCDEGEKYINDHFTGDEPAALTRGPGTAAASLRALGKSGILCGFAQKHCYALAAYLEDRGKLCHGQAFGVQGLGFGPAVELPVLVKDVERFGELLHHLQPSPN